MKGSRWASVPLAAVLLAAGCAGAAPRSSDDSGLVAQGGAAAPSRTLIMVDRHEPIALAPKILAMGGSARTKRLFNAALVLVDGAGNPRPYLAEALLELNSDSWRVFPDGRMETTYRLRPNLTWHDGYPLTAEDFVFGWRVYTTPGLGVFSSTPQDQVETMLAPDPRTLVIRWRTLYPEAGTLGDDTLDPLPRHLLQGPLAGYEQDSTARDAFLNHPYWTNEYVGAGPYRLERWEHGISIEGTAFDGHALGRPRIPRIILRYIFDENTVMANVLAGNVDFATRTTLRVNHGQVLQREWAAAGKGIVLFDPSGPLYNLVQFRPEYQKTPALLAVRVRRALAHAIDKDAINEALYEGRSTTADTFISRLEPYYAAVDLAIAKYPYDPRRAEQLMAEAGFGRDREGFFADASGQRFRPDFEVLDSVDYERVQLVMTDSWRRAGFDVQPAVLPHELVRVNQVRQTYPGIATPGSGGGAERSAFSNFTGAQIGTPANRWGGSNRGGWSNPEYERLWESYNTTLDRSERNGQVVQAMKILSEELPAFPLYYNIYVLAQVAGLHGPEAGVPGTTNYWNLHQWQWR